MNAQSVAGLATFWQQPSRFSVQVAVVFAAVALVAIVAEPRALPATFSVPITANMASTQGAALPPEPVVVSQALGVNAGSIHVERTIPPITLVVLVRVSDQPVLGLRLPPRCATITWFGEEPSAQ